MMNIGESRLQGLLQYLHLLNEVDNGSLPFTMYEQKKVVCKEIEKELGISEPEQLAMDDGEEPAGDSDDEIPSTLEDAARIISDQLVQMFKYSAE